MTQKDILKPDDPLSSSVMPRKRTNWSAMITIILLVAGGLAYAGYQFLGPSGPAVDLPEAVPAAAEGEVIPEEALNVEEEVPEEVPTPEEAAYSWRDATLEGTDYADLPVKEREDGVYLVYEARSGDSIPAVVASYSAAAGFDPQKESDLVDTVTDLHREAFQRALWAGDELLLPVPDELLTAEPAPQMEAAEKPAAGTEAEGS